MKIETPCRNCVFATYDGRVQTGCQLGRLEKYRSQDVVENVRDEAADGLEYCLIHRACRAFVDRDSDIAGQVPAEHRAEVIRKAMTLKLDVIILFAENAKLDDLFVTIDSVKNQKPNSVLVVNNQGKLSPSVITKALTDRCSELNWSMTDIIERNKGERVSKDRCIDLTINRCKGGYYTIWMAGSVLPEKFVTTLDVALNDNLERWSVLLPYDDGNGLTMQVAWHTSKRIGGNTPMVAVNEETSGCCECSQGEDNKIYLNNAAEKAVYFSVIYDQPYLVKHVEEVCPRS